MSEHEENYKGYTIVVERDEAPESPDEYNDFKQVFMCTTHRDFYVQFPKQVNKRNLRLNWWRLPLYAYIHSGVALSLDNTRYPYNDQWDACQIGYVYVKRGKVSGRSREQATETAQRYVDQWGLYLDNNVYCYCVEAENLEFIASCCGFYTEDIDEIIQLARDEVDAEILRKDSIEAAKQLNLL